MLSFRGPKYSFCLKNWQKGSNLFRINEYAKTNYYKFFIQSLQLYLQKLILYFVRKRVMIIHRKLLQFCIFFAKSSVRGGKIEYE